MERSSGSGKDEFGQHLDYLTATMEYIFDFVNQAGGNGICRGSSIICSTKSEDWPATDQDEC